MHLRRIFYGRVGALARERRQLLLKLPVSGAIESAPEASSRLADVRTVAQQLQDNSCTEFRMYLQLTSAYRRGVSYARDCTVQALSFDRLALCVSHPPPALLCPACPAYCLACH